MHTEGLFLLSVVYKCVKIHVSTCPLPRSSIHLTGVEYKMQIKQHDYYTGVPWAAHTDLWVFILDGHQR